jgi:murein DD-endopeptidase MepM/ murein hydrolase activator NlpD
VSTLRKYKRIENSLFQKCSALMKNSTRRTARFLDNVWRGGKQKFTIMLVPHSEKKIFNFQITIFAFFGIVLLLVALLSSFIWYTTNFSSTADLLTQKSENLKSTQASLDAIRDETSELLKTAKNFEVALSTTLGAIGIKSPGGEQPETQKGDLSSFFDMNETVSGTLKEISELNQVTGYLERSIDPIKELGSLLNSKNALLTDIPNVWPIKNGIGHISMYFGQNENPFTGLWYLHKGLDLSTFRSGDQVIATADGEVVMIGYDSGFGNYIIIKHKHGFYTRYAHLSTFRVSKGQKVQQAQTIGYIGNTGLSTGPHLHYEVHLGADVLDPIKFLNLRNSLASANEN